MYTHVYTFKHMYTCVDKYTLTSVLTTKTNLMYTQGAYCRH